MRKAVTYELEKYKGHRTLQKTLYLAPQEGPHTHFNIYSALANWRTCMHKLWEASIHSLEVLQKGPGQSCFQYWQSQYRYLSAS